MINEIRLNFYYKIALNIVSFVSSILIVKIVGVEGRGVLTALTVLILSTLTISNFGSGNGIVFFINHYLPNPEILFRIVVRLIFFTLIVGLIILFGVVNLNILEEFNTVGLNGFVLLILLFTTEVFFFYYNKILIGKSLFHLSNSMSVFAQVLVVIFLYILSIKLSNKLYVVILSQLMSKFLVLLFSFYSKKIKFSATLKFTDNIKIVRGFGWKTYLADISSVFQSRFDQIVIAVLLPMDQLGTYVILVYLAEIVHLIPDSIGPSLLNLNYQNCSIDRKLKLTLVSMRVGMYFSMLLSLAIYFVSVYVILPYGYGIPIGQNDSVLGVLLLGTYFFGYSKYLTKFLNGYKGMTSYISSTMTVSTVVNIVLVSFAAMKSCNILYVAWATTFSNLAISSFLLFKFVRLTNLKYVDVFVFDYADLKTLLSGKVIY